MTDDSEPVRMMVTRTIKRVENASIDRLYLFPLAIRRSQGSSVAYTTYETLMAQHPPLPERIGNYVVLGLLGGGGMGDVYRVRRQDGDREFALKVLKFSYPRALHYFKREFRAVASLAHDNLVSLYDLHYEHGQYFYTMELVDGTDMYIHVNGHNRVVTDPIFLYTPERLEKVRDATVQLLRGLAFLHHHQRVHRDIKPSNILVNVDGRVKLVDFGIVKELIPGGEGQSLSQVFGTSTYFSPEQSLGSHVGPEADLYSVGVLLYELLSGSPPFVGESASVALKHRTEEPPPFKPVRNAPESVRTLQELCLRLLRKKKEDRPTAAEALKSLGEDVGFDDTEREFIGRDAARKTLWDALGDTVGDSSADRARSGRLVIIEGDSGIGKTELLKSFAAQARKLQKATFFTGTCVQRDHVAMRGLDTLVERIAEAYRKETARIMRRFESSQLAALINAFGFLGELLPVEEHGVDDRRSTAATGLRSLLSKLADKRVLVLVVEQLHLADDSVFDVLDGLHAGGELPPVLLICTIRPDLVEDTSRAADFLEFAYRLGSTTRVVLEPFSRHEVREYLEKNHLDLFEPQLTKFIHEATQGNPLLVRLMVDAAIRAIRDDAQQPTWPSLEETITRLLEECGQNARQIVHALAVNHNPAKVEDAPLSVPTLADAAGLDTESVYEAIRQLASRDIAELATDTSGQALVIASHDRLMEIVRQGVDLTRWHTRLAEAHERHRGSGSVIEFHWTQAGHPERIRDYVLRDLRRDPSNDRGHLRRVEMIQLLLRTPDTTLDRIDLYQKMRFSLEQLGRYSEAAEAIEEMERLNPAAITHLRHDRCRYYLRAGKLAKLLRDLEAHADDLPGKAFAPLAGVLVDFLPLKAHDLVDGRTELRDRLVRARLLAQKDHGRRVANASALVAECEEESTDEGLEWYVRLTLAQVDCAQADGRFQDAQAEARDALDVLNGSAVDPVILLPTLQLELALARSLLESGRIDVARKNADALVRRAQKHGLPGITTLARLLKARASLLSGQPVIADGLIEHVAANWSPAPPSLPGVFLWLTIAEKRFTDEPTSRFGLGQQLTRNEVPGKLRHFLSHRSLARRCAILDARMAITEAFHQFVAGEPITVDFGTVQEELRTVRPRSHDWLALVDAFDYLRTEETQNALDVAQQALETPRQSNNALAGAVLWGLTAAIKRHCGQGGHKDWKTARDMLNHLSAQLPPELSTLAERFEQEESAN